LGEESDPRGGTCRCLVEGLIEVPRIFLLSLRSNRTAWRTLHGHMTYGYARGNGHSEVSYFDGGIGTVAFHGNSELTG
jgi:hypothetical protein